MEAVDGITPLLFGNDCEPGTGEVAYMILRELKGIQMRQRLTSSFIFFVKGAELEFGRTRAGRRVKSPLDNET